MKIVINSCYGGYGLSQKASDFLGFMDKYEAADLTPRDHPKLIECIETLGEKANGEYANLKIVYVPDNATDWDIEEYDGFEGVRYVVNGKMHFAEPIIDEDDE